MCAWQHRKWWSELWENADLQFGFFIYMQNINVSTAPFLLLPILWPFLHLLSFHSPLCHKWPFFFWATLHSIYFFMLSPPMHASHDQYHLSPSLPSAILAVLFPPLSCMVALSGNQNGWILHPTELPCSFSIDFSSCKWKQFDEMLDTGFREPMIFSSFLPTKVGVSTRSLFEIASVVSYHSQWRETVILRSLFILK